MGCDGGSETVDSGRDEFQSTHPSGVRHLEGRRHSHPIDFNPRTPVGCDLSPPLIRRCRRYFNPRTPVGCDLHVSWTCRAILIFQSTHPSGVRPRHATRASGLCGFQSTHPSGVRHLTRLGVSKDVIFQSTHPSGVRPPRTNPTRGRRYFNPRTPVGCDRVRHRSEYHHLISIHAPQWGATVGQQQFGGLVEFQSTHPSGVRPSKFGTFLRKYDISIHAPQWGATRRRRHHPSVRGYFNPRTPVGCDQPAIIIGVNRYISIHAPQWGATWIADRIRILEQFQSTHPSGVRRGVEPLEDGVGVISIHAPQWGAT